MSLVLTRTARRHISSSASCFKSVLTASTLSLLLIPAAAMSSVGGQGVPQAMQEKIRQLLQACLSEALFCLLQTGKCCTAVSVLRAALWSVRKVDMPQAAALAGMA